MTWSLAKRIVGCVGGLAALCALVGYPLLAAPEERAVSESKPLGVEGLALLVQNYDRVEVQEQPWGTLRWLMSAQHDPAAQLTLGVAEIKPGHKNPLHKHPNSEEVIYMLSGSCEHRVGDRKVILRPGDVLRIPANVPHDARVLGDEPMKSVVVYNTGERQFVLVEE